MRVQLKLPKCPYCLEEVSWNGGPQCFECHAVMHTSCYYEAFDKCYLCMTVHSKTPQRVQIAQNKLAQAKLDAMALVVQSVLFAIMGAVNAYVYSLFGIQLEIVGWVPLVITATVSLSFWLAAVRLFLEVRKITKGKQILKLEEQLVALTSEWRAEDQEEFNSEDSDEEAEDAVGDDEFDPSVIVFEKA